MKIGKITAPTARNANLFGEFSCMINKQNAATTLASSAGTHQTGSPCPDNHNINIGCHHHFTRTNFKPKIPKPCSVHPTCREPSQWLVNIALSVMLWQNHVMGDAFMDWLIYIVECRDGSLYTGITNDLQKRIDSHNAGTGAKYTAARRPVRLVYREDATSRSSASKREITIKRLTRKAKQALCLKP